MKILKENLNNQRRFLNNQPIIAEKKYKRFLYTIDVNCDKNYRVFNILTETLIELTEDEYKQFRSLPLKYSPWMNELINKWFIVTEETDPLEELEKLRLFCRDYVLTKKEKKYIILPTTACNARCYYCFESNILQRTMNQQVADDVAKYILLNKHKEKVEIKWFGGEPLIAEKIIDSICSSIKNQGLNVISSMISNGYLFNEEIINKAVSLWNLKEIQITIDGTEDIYNETKSYVGVSNNISPYKRVLNNINLLLKANIEVNIRINVNKDNIKDVEKLCEELYQIFKGNTKIYIYLAPIHENYGTKPVTYKEDEFEQIRKKCRELEKSLKELNLNKNIKLPSFRIANCMADDPSIIIINPDGNLQCCEHYIDKSIYGSIYSDLLNEEEMNKWRKYKYLPICKDCPLLPSCGMHDFCPVDIDCNIDIKNEKMASVIEAIKKYKED